MPSKKNKYNEEGDLIVYKYCPSCKGTKPEEEFYSVTKYNTCKCFKCNERCRKYVTAKYKPVGQEKRTYKKCHDWDEEEQ